MTKPPATPAGSPARPEGEPRPVSVQPGAEKPLVSPVQRRGRGEPTLNTVLTPVAEPDSEASTARRTIAASSHPPGDRTNASLPDQSEDESETQALKRVSTRPRLVSIEGRRFVGGETGGIPFTIFKPETDVVVTGGSGERELRTTITSSQIKIDDFNNHDFYFEARIDEETGLVEFNINNKGIDDGDERHPDIYPRELVKQAVAFFRTQGHTVKGITAFMIKNPYEIRNEIHEEYTHNLTSLGKDTITDEDRKQAAADTWIGRLAADFGFSRVDSVEERVISESTSTVDITYRRPQEILEGDELALNVHERIFDITTRAAEQHDPQEQAHAYLAAVAEEISTGHPKPAVDSIARNVMSNDPEVADEAARDLIHLYSSSIVHVLKDYSFLEGQVSLDSLVNVAIDRIRANVKMVAEGGLRNGFYGGYINRLTRNALAEHFSQGVPIRMFAGKYHIIEREIRAAREAFPGGLDANGLRDLVNRLETETGTPNKRHLRRHVERRLERGQQIED